MFPQLKAAEWIAAGVLLLVAAASSATLAWKINGWRLGKQIDDIQKIYLAQANAAAVKYAAEIKKQQDENETAAQAHEEAQGKLESKLTALRAQLAKERTNYVAASTDKCTHPFTTDLPRDLNRLSAVADGTSVPAATPATPNPPEPSTGPSPTSEVTGTTLVQWYADITEQYGKCRQALEDIKKWDHSQ